MTDINQAAAAGRDATKAGWVKPAILSFVPAVEAQANLKVGQPDAGGNLS